MDAPRSSSANIEQLDLLDQAVFKQMQEYVDWIVIYDSAEDAFFIARGLPRVLAQYPQLTGRPSELASGYERMLAVTRAAALPRLNDEEIMTLFQKGIVTVARTSEIDLIGKITAKLVQIPWVEDRDEYRKKLRFELRQNNEWLTLQNIRTTAGVVPPTVKEWISLAEKSAFENEPLTSAIFTNKVFQGLSRNEQIVVQRILAIDDFLSLSSASPEGFELATTVVDENGQRLVFEGGEVRPAADPKSEQLLKQYFTIRRSIVQLRTAHAAADEARYEQQEALLQQTGSDMNKVLPMLKDALVRSDLPRVVTATMVLVRAGAIKDVLKDQAVRDGLVTNLLKPLADRAGVPLATVLAKLNANVDQPVYVGACLRWLLETAFPGNPAEAARVGHQAEQLLGALGNTSLTGLTYFDTRANQFAWTPMRMNPDGMLVWQR